MTKEITKAIILQELEDKFHLRDFENERFLFSELVIPTYDIGNHVKTYICEKEELSITSAAGYAFFSVPQTERWVLHRYDVVFMGAGAYTVSGVYVNRKVGDNIYLDLSAAQSASYHHDVNPPITLNRADVIAVNVDGYTSTQNLRLYIDYTKETIR